MKLIKGQANWLVIISEHMVNEEDIVIDTMIVWWEKDFDENNEEFYRFGIY